MTPRGPGSSRAQVSRSMRVLSRLWGQSGGDIGGGHGGTFPLGGNVPRTVSRLSRDKCPADVSRPPAAAQGPAPQPGRMRDAMPQTAAWVDELRAAFGAEAVDAAIRAGVQAQREAHRIAQTQGPEAAQRWLAAQPFPAGHFHAEERGHVVGVQRP